MVNVWYTLGKVIELLEEIMMKNQRKVVSISLTENEQAQMREWAKKLGLSLSAFIRLAAMEYILSREEREK